MRIKLLTLTPLLTAVVAYYTGLLQKIPGIPLYQAPSAYPTETLLDAASELFVGVMLQCCTRAAMEKMVYCVMVAMAAFLLWLPFSQLGQEISLSPPATVEASLRRENRDLRQECNSEKDRSAALRLLPSTLDTAERNLRRQNGELVTCFDAEREKSAALGLLLSTSTAAEDALRLEHYKLRDLFEAEKGKAADLQRLLETSRAEAAPLREDSPRLARKCDTQRTKIETLQRLVNTFSTGLSTLSVEVRGLASLRDSQEKSLGELTALTTRQDRANLLLRDKLWNVERSHTDDKRYLIKLKIEVNRLRRVEQLLEKAEDRARVAEGEAQQQRRLRERTEAEAAVLAAPSPPDSSCTRTQTAPMDALANAIPPSPSPSPPPLTPTLASVGSPVTTHETSTGTSFGTQTDETRLETPFDCAAGTSLPTLAGPLTTAGSLGRALQVLSPRKGNITLTLTDFGLPGDTSVMGGPNFSPSPGMNRVTPNGGGSGFGSPLTSAGTTNGASTSNASDDDNNLSASTLVIGRLSSRGGVESGGCLESSGSHRSRKPRKPSKRETIAAMAAKKWHDHKSRKKTGYFDPSRMPVGYGSAEVSSRR